MKQKSKKKGEGKVLLSNICRHIARCAFLLKEAVNRQKGFQHGFQKEKEKASEALGDFSPLLARYWLSTERKEALLPEAFDVAHKEGFGNGRRWERKKAAKEVDDFLSRLRSRLKYLEFLQDIEESKAEKGIVGKISVFVFPEPLFLPDHEAFVLVTFLEELEANMKAVAKQAD